MTDVKDDFVFTLESIPDSNQTFDGVHGGHGLATRHRFSNYQETQSLPGSPFNQRRAKSPITVGSARSTEHVPELPQIKGRYERMNSSSSDSTSLQKVTNYDTGAHHICSPGNSPSLRRKVLQRCRPILICHDIADSFSRSDEGSHRGSNSPGSPIQETIESLFPNTSGKKSSTKSVSPLISPRLHRRPGTPLVKGVTDSNALTTANVHPPSPFQSPHHTPRQSPCPSPRHSPCPSPRNSRCPSPARRRNVSNQSQEPHKIEPLTMENVKAFQGQMDKDLSHCDTEFHPSMGSSDKAPTRTGFSHEHELITATLVVKNSNPNPIVGVGGMKPTLNNNNDARISVVDLESDNSIQPPMAPNADEDEKDNDTIRRCQEWLNNIKPGPKSSLH
ncbi:uncharacterized protein LOC144344592 [Saccoglossus kowalevskii]